MTAHRYGKSRHRLDAYVALHDVLAGFRRLEDSAGSAALISATAGSLRLVETLAQEAHGAIRTWVIDLAGQWAQFPGWLRAANGQPGKAREWYARALEPSGCSATSTTRSSC